MKKIFLFGIAFLVAALVASSVAAITKDEFSGYQVWNQPTLAVTNTPHTPDHIGNFNFVIDPKTEVVENTSTGHDNIGFLLRGISKEELKRLTAEHKVVRFKAGIDLSHTVRSVNAGGLTTYTFTADRIRGD